MPDCALIDVHLGNGTSFELLAALRALGVPFVVTSGYDAATLPADLAQAPYLSKPLQPDSVVDAVISACGRGLKADP